MVKNQLQVPTVAIVALVVPTANKEKAHTRYLP